jgi:5,10-methylenetetrahydromethanopterin reductase
MLRLAGELCDGVLPLLFPPEHYFTVQPIVVEGLSNRLPSLLGEGLGVGFDLAVCIWVALDEDRDVARRVLAQKIAYYGHALSPLIYERLGVTQEAFRPIEHALMVERDEDKAAALVNDKMLRIGVVGNAYDLVARLRPLVDAGARHISFGPPLGSAPLKAIELLGREVLPELSRYSPISTQSTA